MGMLVGSGEIGIVELAQAVASKATMPRSPRSLVQAWRGVDVHRSSRAAFSRLSSHLYTTVPFLGCDEWCLVTGTVTTLDAITCDLVARDFVQCNLIIPFPSSQSQSM